MRSDLQPLTTVVPRTPAAAGRRARIEGSVAHDSGRSSRGRFVALVAEAFDRAGVDYTVLHGAGDGGVDSDIDIAVGRRSLATVDTLIRLGTFGRLLQCLHYDVPWCSWYVVETGDASRPYRQLDVACDPWGIGRYGSAIPVSLSHSERGTADGVRRPAPAAEAFYLAVKRARKGLARPQDENGLRSAYRRDPREVRALLEQSFGRTGAAVADALDRDGPDDLSPELAALARQLARQRRRPSALARRAALSAARLGSRLLRPSGLVVCIAGPDGSGKSTLAEALAAAPHGAFRRQAHLHLAPSVLPAPARLLGRPAGNSELPHDRPPSGSAASLARLAYGTADALLGWLPQITLPRLRSTLVIVERGRWDLTIDRRRYRLGLPHFVVRAFAAMTPRPDLVLLLEAQPPEIRRRKPELSVAEIDRQLTDWRARAEADPGRFAVLDASSSPDELLRAALRAIDDRLASRPGDLSACRFGVECLGRPTDGGVPHVAIRAGGRFRWLLPAARSVPGPLLAGLYRPASTRHRGRALALEAAHRLGSRRDASMRLDPGAGVAPEIAAALGRKTVELAAAVTGGDGRDDRLLVSVLERGRPIAFAKIVPSSATGRLDHERAVLEALGGSSLRSLAVPRVVCQLRTPDLSILLLAPVEVRGYADRPLGVIEIETLAELARIGAPLTTHLGTRKELVPVHGDFAPWNCSRQSERLMLWDWESARLGRPFEDLFHWRLQRLALFGHGNVADLVAGALQPDRQVRLLGELTGVSPDEAPWGLRAALRSDLEPSVDRKRSSVVSVRREALQLLEGGPR